VAGAAIIGGSVLLGVAGRTSLAHRVAEPGWRAPTPTGVRWRSDALRRLAGMDPGRTSILDNPSARGMALVGVSAGRPSGLLPLAGTLGSLERGAEGGGVRPAGRDVEAFRQRGLRAAAILDVYSPALVRPSRPRPRLRFDGERSAEQVEFMELVEGDYGREVVSLASYLAHSHDLEAVALTELGYRSYCFDDRCLASYRATTGRQDWPRRPSGVVDVDDPTVWEWRTARMEASSGGSPWSSTARERSCTSTSP